MRGVEVPLAVLAASRGSSSAWTVGNSSTGARTITAAVVKPAASAGVSVSRAVTSTGARFHTPCPASSSAADHSTGATGATAPRAKLPPPNSRGATAGESARTAIQAVLAPSPRTASTTAAASPTPASIQNVAAYRP